MTTGAMRGDVSRDREPQPGDGPDYHAEHAAWARRQPVSRDETAESVRRLKALLPGWEIGPGGHVLMNSGDPTLPTALATRLEQADSDRAAVERAEALADRFDALGWSDTACRIRRALDGTGGPR